MSNSKLVSSVYDSRVIRPTASLRHIVVSTSRMHTTPLRGFCAPFQHEARKKRIAFSTQVNLCTPNSAVSHKFDSLHADKCIVRNFPGDRISVASTHIFAQCFCFPSGKKEIYVALVNSDVNIFLSSWTSYEYLLNLYAKIKKKKKDKNVDRIFILIM